MMKESLLYKLTQYGYKQEVKIDPNRFTHVFTSKYGKLRIFKVNKVSKESKEWVANPENRICDPPGSWMCRGQCVTTSKCVFLCIFLFVFLTILTSTTLILLSQGLARNCPPSPDTGFRIFKTCLNGKVFSADKALC
ncbi:MAG: hypothetical protein COA37_02775 [Hoeflea sp.]|nr:MAG: hypothetical protein COA37_02775 [Hoeflea sp.]